VNNALLVFLIVVPLVHAQSGLRPQHANAQMVTNACGFENYFHLNGIVYERDMVYIHIRWKTSCGPDCGSLGNALDSLGNVYYPDETWGIDGGIKCGPLYCEMRLLTDSAGSKATGDDTLHLPLSRPLIAEYGIDGYLAICRTARSNGGQSPLPAPIMRRCRGGMYFER
jgi:hypothetical protein